MNWPIKIQGRFLTETDVNEVRKLLHDNPSWHRTRLSRELCKYWNWQRADGQLKDIACRELLRKLEKKTLIKLPPRQRSGPKGKPTIESVAVDRTIISSSLTELKPIKVIDARNSSENEKTFNYLVKEYHYLGFGRPVGQNMKYLILGNNNCYLGCFLFGAAAWKSADRDQWIGWSAGTREKNLGLICNNTRFLILPWVDVFNLASHAISACLHRLPKDWKQRYGTEVIMVETFVDTTRYVGTCYKAANFLNIGQTKGRSRQDRNRNIKVPVKDIWVYPLKKNFKELLQKTS